MDEALRVPRTIAENYAFKPTSPLNVAVAMNMQPTSGQFRMLTGAATAYGLTTGGATASEIAITALGLRVVRPTREGDDLQARREALLRPRVVGEFLQKYNNSPLPRADIAANVLVEMEVPKDRSDEVLDLILQGAKSVGLLKEIRGKEYVDLSGAMASAEQATEPEPVIPPVPSEGSDGLGQGAPTTSPLDRRLAQEQSRRVFISHGKNKAFLDTIKKLLAFGELEPIVSVEKTSVSQPVPDKVMSDMRNCGAAIIHVDAEVKAVDKEGVEHTFLNPNVLIEIGAAMALFGRRFILLVREGLVLPSNLQGLFEVRFSGDALDGNATIKLLEAINDIKNHPMPDRYRQ